MNILSAALAAGLFVTAAATVPAADAATPARDPATVRAAAFARVDANKDNILSREEITTIAKQRAARLDVDKNGVVTKAEYAAAGKATARREAHFAKLDKAGVGSIPLGRLEKIHLRRLARLDANKDGSITREEFLAARPKKAG